MTSDGPPGSAPTALDDGLVVSMVHGLADAVVVADAEGRIVLWNDAAARLFGWPADEAIGQTLDLIVPERLRGRHWAGYDRVMATGATRYGDRLLEVPALHRDGRTLSIAFTVTLIHRSDGATPWGIAAVMRDETERRRQEREHAA
jgi:PAS domain S-box-containing protein